MSQAREGERWGNEKNLRTKVKGKEGRKRGMEEKKQERVTEIYIQIVE